MDAAVTPHLHRTLMTPTSLRRTLFVALLFSSSASFADDWIGFAAVGPDEHASVGLGKVVGKGLAVRAALGTRGSGSYHRTVDDVQYDVHRRSSTSLSALMDWYPVRNSGLRVSGGVSLLDRNEGTLRVADSPDGPLTGKVSYSRLERYLGVGWESAPIDQAGWRFTSDLGVHLGHRSRVALTTSSGRDATTQRERISSDMGKNYLRIGASIGAAYRF